MVNLTKEQKKFITCENCRASVRDLNLEIHLEKVHGKTVHKTVSPAVAPSKLSEPPISKKVPKVHDVLRNFHCNSCNRRTKLPTGQIRVGLAKNEDFEFFFEHEMKCRHCKSMDLELSNLDQFFILGPLLAKVKVGSYPKPHEDVIFHLPGLSTGENITNQDEAIGILLERAKNNSQNWEAWTRYANVLQFSNRYQESLEPLEKATTLNPRAVAPQLNLGRVFFYRWKTYSEKGVKTRARGHLINVMGLLDTNGDLKTLTGATLQDIAGEVLPMLEELGGYEKDIIMVETSELEKPLSAFILPDEPNVKTVVLHMSVVEEVAKLVDISLSQCLIKYPKTSREKILDTLEHLKDDFDMDCDELTNYLRNLIKLRLLNENKKDKFYKKTDVLSGLCYIKTIFEDNPKSFDLLKQKIMKHAGII